MCLKILFCSWLYSIPGCGLEGEVGDGLAESITHQNTNGKVILGRLAVFAFPYIDKEGREEEICPSTHRYN